jgi:hypothetical protein
VEEKAKIVWHVLEEFPRVSISCQLLTGTNLAVGEHHWLWVLSPINTEGSFSRFRKG